MTETEPSPTDTARATAAAVGNLTSGFMLDMNTYVAAAGAGYEGLAFYFGGRGGVLGDVNVAEVIEAFVFFPDETVRAGWEQAASVESRADAATRFAGAAATWSAEHLPAGDPDAGAPDYARLAELAGKVVAAADATGAPLFAGWRELPEPTEPRALVVHRMNGLRELRFSRHVAAVRAEGVDPVLAFMVKTPFMADIFGWPEPRPEPTEDDRAAWDRAEAATDEAFGRDLAALDPAERAEFVALATAVLAAVT